MIKNWFQMIIWASCTAVGSCNATYAIFKHICTHIYTSHTRLDTYRAIIVQNTPHRVYDAPAPPKKDFLILKQNKQVTMLSQIPCLHATTFSQCSSNIPDILHIIIMLSRSSEPPNACCVERLCFFYITSSTSFYFKLYTVTLLFHLNYLV